MKQEKSTLKLEDNVYSNAVEALPLANSDNKDKKAAELPNDADKFAKKILSSEQFKAVDVFYIVDDRFVFEKQNKSNAFLYADSKNLPIYMVERYSNTGSEGYTLTQLNKQ